jgi:hypothetical protein
MPEQGMRPDNSIMVMLPAVAEDMTALKVRDAVDTVPLQIQTESSPPLGLTARDPAMRLHVSDAVSLTLVVVVPVVALCTNAMTTEPNCTVYAAVVRVVLDAIATEMRRLVTCCPAGRRTSATQDHWALVMVKPPVAAAMLVVESTLSPIAAS